jgi:hypothetical protein
MESGRPIAKAGVRGSAAVLALLAFLPASAAEAPHTPCRADALGQWYCALEPQGSAVVDSLGAVLCAPGRCVEAEGEWQCASVVGGSAEATPSGPVCAGGCRAPRAADCERM